MQKYRFLRFATIVLRVLAWIVLIGGVIGSIILAITATAVVGDVLKIEMGKALVVFVAIAVALAGIIFSFLSWLFLLATRELIYVLVNVEENTKNTAENTGITAESNTNKSP